MNPTYALFAVFMFVAVALSLEGLLQIWASKHSAAAKRLAARLQSIESGGAETLSTIIGSYPSIDARTRYWPGGARMVYRPSALVAIAIRVVRMKAPPSTIKAAVTAYVRNHTLF